MSGKDEIAVMSRNVDQTVHALNDSVEGIKEAASEVQHYSESLTLTTEQIARATSEVTASIQETAQGATSHASGLTKIINMINTFTKEMEAIDDTVGNVRNNSHTAENKAQEGKNQVADLTSSTFAERKRPSAS